jgi:hypothetical protein
MWDKVDNNEGLGKISRQLIDMNRKWIEKIKRQKDQLRQQWDLIELFKVQSGSIKIS